MLTRKFSLRKEGCHCRGALTVLAFLTRRVVLTQPIRAAPYKAVPTGLGERAVRTIPGFSSLCDCTPGYHKVAPLGLKRETSIRES